MSELDLSGKEKSVKPLKRILNLTKSTNCSPHIIPAGILTPISENRRNGLITQLNNDTPMSDASKSSHRRKFCVLSSASYWLAQIKLSESVLNHSVSIGFFRLALESGVEPLHRIREELKSYVLKHNLLSELEKTTKEILNSYNIQEDLEKLHILESGSQLLEDVPLHSGEASKNSATAPRTRNLKPKFLSRNTIGEINKKEAIQKKTPTARKTSPALRNSENGVLMNGSVRSSTLEMSKGKSNSKWCEKNSSGDEVDNSSNEQPNLDKENMAAENMDIYSPK